MKLPSPVEQTRKSGEDGDDMRGYEYDAYDEYDGDGYSRGDDCGRKDTTHICSVWREAESILILAIIKILAGDCKYCK